MFFQSGLMMVAAVFASDQLVDDFFAQSVSFISNEDLNDYSHVFSDDEACTEKALEASPTHFAPKNRKKYNYRHMKIIKEIAEGRKTEEGVYRSLNDLYREAEHRFEAENLDQMNELTLARYISEATCKERTKARSDSSSLSRTSTSSRGFRESDYTKAHHAIVKEVVRKSFAESNLSEERAFREVSKQLRAQNLEPISRALFNSCLNYFVAKCKLLYGDNCYKRNKSQPSMDPKIERVLQMIIDENQNRPISSDRIYAALRENLSGQKHIPKFREVFDWIQNKLRCSRSREADPFSVDKSGESDTSILCGENEQKDAENKQMDA